MDPNVIISIVENDLNRQQNDKDRLANSRNDAIAIDVSLQDLDLWEKFNEKTNEMIVTKGGRRMFPVISVKTFGLDYRRIYSLAIEFVQKDNNRWKFMNGQWVQGGKPEPPPGPNQSLYIHPASPNYGSFWERDYVRFTSVKLTNQTNPGKGQVVLNSLHKYQTRIHVIRMDSLEPRRVYTFDFPQTEFIAVTAYQNEEVTKLKVKHNPFAKAFQEARDEPKPKRNENSESEDGSPVALRQTWCQKVFTVPQEVNCEIKSRKIENIESDETYLNENNGYGIVTGFQETSYPMYPTAYSTESFPTQGSNTGLWTPEYPNNYNMSSNSGGPMRATCFTQRSTGPYGSGYGRSSYK